MKSIYKNILADFLVISVLAGCEDVAIKVKVPPAEKKIVVQCFISPDDYTITALVTWSKPIIGTSVSAEPEYITNANVEISNGIKVGKMQFDSSYALYYIKSDSFKIEAGKKYYLTVSTPDGKKVTANCEVPSTKNTSFELINVDSLTDNMGYKTITCTFRYKDQDASVKNYYRFDVKPVLKDPYEDYYVWGTFKEDDELISGSNTIKLTFYDNGFQGPGKANAWLISSDYNYFKYHKTLQGAQDNLGLFSEPSIVYSNIEGGIGCFGGYYSYQLHFDL